MNDQGYIEFKKKRDLGMMISDTFKFMSIEWKPFIGTIIKAAIIPIIIGVAAMIYYLMSTSNFMSSLTQRTYFDDVSPDFASLFLPLVAFFGAYLIAYALISASALSYIKSYISNKGVVNFEEVNNTTKQKFGSYVGLYLLNGLIIIFGTLFCFLPGIYFSVVLSLSICILMFDNLSTTESINDSFSFIKNHWWETFGIIIVVNIIIGIIGFVVDLPATIYQGIDVGLSLSQDPSELINIFSDPIYLVLVSLGLFVKFILYMVSIVSTTFIYFDIKEQKYPSTPDVIDEIGLE